MSYEEDIEEDVTKKKFFTKTKIIILSIVLAVVVIAIIVALVIVLNKDTVGNTIGNIRNYGYSAYYKGKIYYVSPDADGKKIRINRVDKNGKNQKIILEVEYNILSLNAYNDYLYFIGTSSIESQEAEESSNITDYVDNKIYKMKTDGTGLEVINDNEFSNDDYQIYVIKDRIYYIGTDYNIYYMDLNGSNRTQVNRNRSGFLGISDKYILYNDYPIATNVAEREANASQDSEQYITYIMDIDGNNISTFNGDRLYSVNVVGDYIYYTDSDKNICKVKADGSEKQVLIYTSAYNLNVSNNRIYYLNYKDEANNDYTVSIFSCKLDGNDNKPIHDMEAYSQFLDIVNNSALYIDSRDDKRQILLYNDKSKQEAVLYSVASDRITSDSDGTTEEEASSEEASLME